MDGQVDISYSMEILCSGRGRWAGVCGSTGLLEKLVSEIESLGRAGKVALGKQELFVGKLGTVLVNWELCVGHQGKKLANRCLKYTNIGEAKLRVDFLAPSTLCVCKSRRKWVFHLLIPGESKL